MNPISDFSKLLNEFSNLTREHSSNESNVLLEKFTYLIHSYSPLYENLTKQLKAETPHYNIFEILKVEFLEAKVHTPILTDLLKPNGIHYQGELFSTEFLKMIDNNLVTKNYDSSYLYVKDEFKTPLGIIDILIHYIHPIKENRFVVIIENKINAQDQKDQLSRYYDYVSKYIKYDETRIKIVYLSTDYKGPSNYSISETLRSKLSHTNNFKHLRYNPDIIRWLNICLEQIKSERLRQTLFQYITSIKKFPHEEIE